MRQWHVGAVLQHAQAVGISDAGFFFQNDPNELDAVGQAELLKDIGQVVFDRDLTDEKQLSDFVIQLALAHPCQHFALARRQARKPGRILKLWRERSDQTAHG